MNHEFWMDKALDQAYVAAKIEDVPIGAVVVKENRIIGRGYNHRESDQNPLGHAELMAIREASEVIGSWRLTGCSLYVTLEPCPMCAGAIVQARIDHLIFGTADPKSGYAGSLANVVQDERLNHQVQVTQNILQDECQQLLREFFKAVRNRNEKLKQKKKKEEQS